MAVLLEERQRAGRNRTLCLSDEDRARLMPTLLRDVPASRLVEPVTGTIHGDYRCWASALPLAHVDLLFLDPPYNLDKAFNGSKFARGNVYLAAGQILVFDPAGKQIDIIAVPQRPTCLIFGGPDRQTLFITARSSLYSVKTRTAQ